MVIGFLMFGISLPEGANFVQYRLLTKLAVCDIDWQIDKTNPCEHNEVIKLYSSHK